MFQEGGFGVWVHLSAGKICIPHRGGGMKKEQHDRLVEGSRLIRSGL